MLTEAECRSPGRREDADADLEKNKQTVVEFYALAFNGKEPEQVVEKYVGAKYIQHNPQAPTDRRPSSGS